MTRYENDKPARSVEQISGDSGALRGALRRAEAFTDLNRRLATSLPEAARGHVRVACIEADCLVIAADSPAWSSRARLLADGLLREAADLWPTPLNRCRIIVVPGSEK